MLIPRWKQQIETQTYAHGVVVIRVNVVTDELIDGQLSNF